MREIKFRAFDAVEKRMLTNRELTFVHLNGYESILCNILDGDDDNHKLMQFTGLQDKNGVDIYEGDIVDLLGDGSVVDYICWNDECGSFCAYNDNDKSEHLYGAGMAAIIGNIHQNPELITKG